MVLSMQLMVLPMRSLAVTSRQQMKQMVADVR
jgi:hypothetical protein